MAKWRILLLILIMIPFHTFAANPTPQDLSYTFPNQDITLNYPSGWAVQATQRQLLFATSEEVFDKLPTELEQGEIQLLFVQFTASELGLFEPDTLIDETSVIKITLEGIAQDGDSPIFAEPQPFVSAAYPTVFTIGTLDAVNTLLMVMNLGENNFLLMAGSGDVALNTIAPAMIASLVYDPNHDTLWQVQRSVSAPVGEGFGEFHDMTLAPTGHLYVAQGFRGIQELDSNGNLLRTIQPQYEMAINDITVGLDGTLWIADDFNQLIHQITLNGEVLQTFGDDVRYKQIEFGPDGNLYTFARTNLDNEVQIGIIQVWTQRGELVREFRTSENTEGFTFFSKLRVGRDGRIYLADLIGGIRIFEADGTLVADNFLGETFETPSFTALDLHPSGESLVVAVNDGKIYMVSMEGQILREYGQQQVNSGSEYFPGELSETVGLVVLSNGDVIAADTNFNYSEILRFSFSGL